MGNIKKRNLIKSSQRVAKKGNWWDDYYGINLDEAASNLQQGITFGPIDTDELNRVSGNIMIPGIARELPGKPGFMENLLSWWR